MSDHPNELLKLDPPARHAIQAGADPALTLSYIVWPTPRITTASKSANTNDTPQTRATPQTRRP